MRKPIIHLYSLCYNEEVILPYFLRHYCRFVDKITIYDNYSTDRSEEIIKSFQNTIIEKFDTNNQLRDDIFSGMRNNNWKASRGKADFVIVCDIDELLYHPGMVDFLGHLYQNNYTVAKPYGYEMTSEDLPKTDGQIYDEIKKGVKSRWYNKSVLFNPNEIREINYNMGAHRCFPEGNVKIYRRDKGLKLLHYKFLNADYVFQLYRRSAERLSDINRQNKWGRHFEWKEKKLMKKITKLSRKSGPVI